MNYLRVSRATDLSGRDYIIYRALEIFPGFLSLGTLLFLIILSYFKPTTAAYFIIAFNVYYFLLVVFLALYLLSSFQKLKKNKKVDWEKKSEEIPLIKDSLDPKSLGAQGWQWQDLIHLVIFPTYNESLDVIRASFQGLVNSNYPLDKMMVLLAMEERVGPSAKEKAKVIEEEFAHYFGKFFVSYHPDIEGELKGKGANQAYGAKLFKAEVIDKEGIDYDRIIVSVFDIDTIASYNYFFCLSYRFLTVANPYRASYQPIPVYHNNVWQTPFFARVSSASNTFWQMMQQIRPEKLATYSSHSMTFRALVDIGFWSTNMVSEDSRIFYHCFLHYKGDYRVEPLYFPVSMDATCDKSFLKTVKSLYKQQRRWAWGSENVPYLIFNYFKNKKGLNKARTWRHIWIQIYGFHSWATTALIIGFVGWLPMLLGGDRFNATVMVFNLPAITRTLMTISMLGLFISAIVSSLLLPKKPKNYGFFKTIALFFEWLCVPVVIIFFGAIPCLDAQIRLMFGRYMGFWVTPKSR
ncbi:MAG TPA: glycosyltransferase family 2 protein [Patescibacteria group bacterium]|nr:glycosyltransferase family 2 protein [Patescibacteria group bacterium]